MDGTQTLTATFPSASLQHQADLDLARRSHRSALVYLVLYVVICAFTPYPQTHAPTVALVGIFILLAGAYRTWLVIRFDPLHTRKPERWRQRFRVSTLLLAGVWGLFCTLAVYHFGLEWTAMLTLLSTAGISAGAITTLSIDRTLIMTYLGLLLLPPTAAAAFLQNSQGIAITLMFLTYAIFMFGVAGRLNREYWEALRNNELLKQRARDLEASNRELESYSYSIAHDLRTPLRSIISFSQILLENPHNTLNQDEIADLGRVVRAGMHMAALIDDILELARIARKDLEYREMDLSAMAESYLRQLAEAEPERNVLYSVQPGLRVTGDPKLLEVALRNLLDNAWKFTRYKTCGEIDVSATHDGTDTVFCVVDNGIGFDMRYADRLFKPFERLHDNREFPGTGVGLAIVHRILLRHGGRIWAEAETGKGACFCFVTGAV